MGAVSFYLSQSGANDVKQIHGGIAPHGPEGCRRPGRQRGFRTVGGHASARRKCSPEKEALKFGFIKLTDCAPLAIALEKHFFEDEGLAVSLEAQANWKVLLDRVIDGELDGAHMLAGQPLGAGVGFGTKAEIVTALSMDLNGNAITVSNEVWKELKPLLPTKDGRVQHPIAAGALKKVVDHWKSQGRAFKMGMVFPVSTHNYELRYWLAAGGLHPGYYTRSDVTGTAEADVLLSVTPPPQMPATMEAGTINGYCVGEPWNQQAVAKHIGVPVIIDHEIWAYKPEKVFGVTRAWADKYPNTHVAVTKALIRACMWLDESMANRIEAVKMLARPAYVGADAAVIGNSMTGTFEFEPGDKRPAPDFNVFFRHFATYPYYSDAIWYLTQMRRWGQIPDSRPDSWYFEMARKVYRPDVYRAAAAALVAEGRAKAGDFPTTDGFKDKQGALHRRHRVRPAPPQRLPQQIPHRHEGRGQGLKGSATMHILARLAGADPRETARRLLLSLGAPLLAFALFLGLWSAVAARIHTSLGVVPGPAAGGGPGAVAVDRAPSRSEAARRVLRAPGRAHPRAPARRTGLGAGAPCLPGPPDLHHADRDQPGHGLRGLRAGDAGGGAAGDPRRHRRASCRRRSTRSCSCSARFLRSPGCRS